jgi:hypothetical protein
MSEQRNTHPGASGRGHDARRAMVEVCAYYKYVVTDFEASMWTKLINEYGDQAVVAFLQEHVRTSTFAPKIADAQRLLSPVGGNEEAAFLRLTEEVRRRGPYGNPRFDDDPAIAAAVSHLGGWATLNAEMPDPGARFDYEAYQRRFAAAYQMARSQRVVMGAVGGPAGSGVPRVHLRGLHALSAPAQRALVVAQGEHDTHVMHDTHAAHATRDPEVLGSQAPYDAQHVGAREKERPHA